MKERGSIGEIKNLIRKEIRQKIYDSLIKEKIIKDKTKFELQKTIIDGDFGFHLILTTPDLLHVIFKIIDDNLEEKFFTFCIDRDNLELIIED